MRRPTIPWAALALCLACASASVPSSQRFVEASELPRPPVMLVHDFAVSPEDVVVDTFGPNFAGSSPTAKRDEAGREVAAALAQALVAKLNERGVRAERATHDSIVPENAFVLKGQFVTIDEGDRLKRMTIGFGAGSPEMRVRVQVYQMTGGGLRRIAAAEGEARGNRMPGVAVPVGVGAAAGAAVRSVVISGGINVAQEISGELRGNAERLADKLAERAVTFYRDQGWI